MSPLFDDVADKPAIVSPPKSSLRSAQSTGVFKSASGPQKHHVLNDVSGHVTVHGQRTLCFVVGSIAEPKPTP